MTRPAEIILFCFVMTSLIGCSRDTSIASKDALTVISQNVEDRRFVRVPTDSTYLDLDIGNLFVRSLQVNGDSTLLALDEANVSLVRISPKHDEFEVIGAGRGSGPGEHVVITNYGQTQAGTIWTFDATQSRVTLFDRRGVFESTIPLDASVQQVSVKESGIFGFSLNDGGSIIRLSPDGRSQEVAMVFSGSSDGKPGLKWSGHMIEGANNDGWVHVASNVNSIMTFIEPFKLSFAMFGIDGPQDPSIVNHGDSYSFDSNASLPIQIFGLNVWEDTIYVLALHHVAEQMTLDAYSAVDGSYKYSFRIPVSTGCAPLFVTDTDIFSRCPAGLVKLARVDVQ
ncbi:MAG: hypothetical protein RIE53_13165 [Rhodothermales bacterium]